jgi:hypothetical protein
VASLLLGARTARLFPNGVNWKTLDVDALTNDFNDSDEGQLLLLIRNGQLERRKQEALYQDDVLTAIEDEFAALHVGGILKIARDAQEVLAVRFIWGAGRAFYEATS